ncbi:dTMP kinase [Terribacillus saccharophilus]|uniref:Thymidylate kinase n=1 Tax=Terribacillus saccharophilus TaxID=361277 RepID=A0A268H8M2_9BACI|nr:dTMP kinase [Terribacillus saccharophilus]PAD33606.1 dTMP kinase [Terribacillus saccharophilus]PAD94430.1 dTMP kinase [Terribacillus saccharophilus]PAD98196.1 dTMP kinase [Terribacillus saccharophilus]PAE06222.1 dTMP kinase [Terribacillus saccharophilus]
MTGLFITLEGGEGAGKTSAVPLLTARLEEQGYQVLATREPGGIEIAEAIRAVILDPANTSMDGRTEALLYAAARRQHLVEKVWPALKKGMIVLCDRFVDSSLAYQGYTRGLGMEEVMDINRFAVETTMPDLTLFFDISPKAGLARISENKGREQNRLDLEALSFHESVYEGYQILREQYKDRYVTLDASKPLADVAENAVQAIMAFLQDKEK